MIKRVAAPLGALLIAASSLLAPGMAVPSHAAVSLVGAGSTFDFPFFDLAFRKYAAKTGVNVNYQSIGSGAGVQLFIAKQVDFGATDVPLDPTSDLKKAVAAGGPVQQVPVTLGGVAMGYNLPGIKTGLHLTGTIIADIYLGLITKWNDARIRAVNKGVKLPDLQVTPAYRSDGSGTSYAFTDYLAKINDTWRQRIGVSKLPAWPAGVGAKGNSGVAQTVQNTKGAISYIELAYVVQNHMTYGSVQNKAKAFVLPAPKSIAAAAAAFPKVSASHFSITNAPGKTSYPISTYSWVLLYQHQADATKGSALKALMTWMVSPAGQFYARTQYYVELPRTIAAIAKSSIAKVQ